MISKTRNSELDFGFSIGITRFCPISASGAFRVKEIEDIKVESPAVIVKAKEKNLETRVALSHDISSSKLENSIIETSYAIPVEIIQEIAYPIVKDIIVNQTREVLVETVKPLQESSNQFYISIIPIISFRAYHVSYTSQPHSEVFSVSYSKPEVVSYSNTNYSVSYTQLIVYSTQPSLIYEFIQQPLFYSAELSYSPVEVRELDLIKELLTYQNIELSNYQQPEIKANHELDSVVYLIQPELGLMQGYEIKIPSTENKTDYISEQKPEIKTIDDVITELKPVEKTTNTTDYSSTMFDATEFVSTTSDFIDYKPSLSVDVSSIDTAYVASNTDFQSENIMYVVSRTETPGFSGYVNIPGIELLQEQETILQGKKLTYVDESKFVLKPQRTDIECAVLPVLESYSDPNSCFGSLSLDQTNITACDVVPDLEDNQIINILIKGDKAELSVCPVIPGLEERFYVDSDTQVRWFSVSKNIISSSLASQDEYHIKVKESVDFDRPFYETKSADYITKGNSVVAIVDKILKEKGLVPVWEVPYEISSETSINSGKIYLKDIMGVESVAKERVKSNVEVDYIVEITDRHTFEKTLVSLQDIIKQEHLDTEKYAIDIIAQTRTSSKKTEKVFVEEIEQGYRAPVLRKLKYDSEILRSEPGQGRFGISEFQLNIGDIYDIVIMMQGHYDRNSENMQGAFSITPIEITNQDMSNSGLYVMEIKDSYGFDRHLLTNANSTEAIFDRKLREQGLRPVFINYSTRRDDPGLVYQTGAKDNHVELGLMGIQGASGELLSNYQDGKVYEIGLLIEKLNFKSIEARENYVNNNLRKIAVELHN